MRAHHHRLRASSGIDLALNLLERFFGAGARQREAMRLEGSWR